MKVRAIVEKVEQLPAREGQSEEPLTAISLEGFSVLARPSERMPAVGQEIEAIVSIQWRKGKRPLHWMRSWTDSII